MYEYSGNFVTTYDPKYIEHHDDSSEFEECIPITNPKQGNHSLLNQKPRRNKKSLIRKLSNIYIDYDEYPVRLKQEKIQENPKTHLHIQKSEMRIIREKIRTNSHKTQDSIHPVKSKISMIMKHKVIPCLSHIFKRNHSSKHMSIIQENRVENIPDNCYNRCSDCQQRRIRKLYNSRNYAVQPVYALEGNVHKTPASFAPKITAPVKKRKKLKDQYCDPRSASSSSDSDVQSAQERRHKVKRFRNILKAEIMKEHQKYQQAQNVKHQHLQYPSKDHQIPYQVYNTPYQSRTYMEPRRNNEGFGELPSSTSNFWEFLFDKVGRKYQAHRVELPRPCNCSDNTTPTTTCSPLSCTNRPQEPSPEQVSKCKGRNQSTINGNSCSCKTKEQASGNYHNKPNSPSHSSNESTHSAPMVFKPPDHYQPNMLQASQPKNPCKCKERRLTTGTQAQNSESLDFKPCQEGHDNITQNLADKYNGEILCIHNPPCILINGCLNLPPQREQQQMSFWPVTDVKKSLFSKNKKPPVREQSCQYHVPYVEVHQCELKPEKKIQSVCNHDPPCEVVRGCCKAKFDPYLQNSCVHVPMCKKIPECSVGKSKVRPCAHRPRCPEIPTCSRNYLIMPANDSIATQVKNSYICRHEPPCVMVPKCLVNDFMPECPHLPFCETIPACQMKSTKDMVSVSSQYPNACRIV